MIEEPLSKLATASILGTLLVIAIGAIVYLFYALQKSHNERLADAMRDAAARLADQKDVTKLSEASAERLMKMQEVVKTANEQSVRLVEEFEKLREREHERELREADRERERDQRERERELRATGAHRPVSG